MRNQDILREYAKKTATTSGGASIHSAKRYEDPGQERIAAVLRTAPGHGASLTFENNAGQTVTVVSVEGRQGSAIAWIKFRGTPKVRPFDGGYEVAEELLAWLAQEPIQ